MNPSTRPVSIGEQVIWHEADGTPLNALVTAVWSIVCINIVIVSGDQSRQDDFGRQIERRTSCSHKSLSTVHGFYWHFPDEEANPFVPPEAT